MSDPEQRTGTARDGDPPSGGNGGARDEGYERDDGVEGIDPEVQAALDARDVSDPALMPVMSGASIDELKTYQSLYIVDTVGTPPANVSALTGAVDAFDRSAVAEDLPAIGVLTTHQQSWTQKGLALGNLLHSVCLAPGEVTQVAVVDWERRSAGTSRETAEQGEDVTSAADQTRAVNEVQNAVAREAQAGGSSSSATAASAQAGGSFGGLFMAASASGSLSTTSAMTAQFSTGTRNLAASSTNALSQRTAERSQALRSRRAAVVKEVSEHEAENLSARVLANYNRRHALNIEYFEVLQLYAIETKLANWDRCLFVPMKLIDFTADGAIEKHKASLTRFFIESGRPELVEQLLFGGDPDAEKRITQEIASLDAQLTAARAEVQEINDKYETLRRARPLADDLDTARKRLSEARPADRWTLQGPEALARQAYDRFISTTANAAKWLPDGSQAGIATTISSVMNSLARRNNELRGVDATTKTSGTIWQADKDRQELLNQRAAMRLTRNERLMAEQLTLSQAIWLQMDPFAIYRMLAKYKLGEEPLATLVAPYPVGVFGNYLAFRWGFQRTKEGEQKRSQFEKSYITDGEAGSVVTSDIAVPTSGVFAEAVLGRGQAAETIDDTRLWDWQAFPIPILPQGLASLSRDRAKALSLDGHDFASALAQLRATSPEDASHLDELIGALGNASMFRDMGGLAQAVTLADKVAAISGEGAQDAGARAAEIHGKILDTFVEVLNSDVGKAAVAEFMLPGAGAAVLGSEGANGKSDGGASEKAERAKVGGAA